MRHRFQKQDSLRGAAFGDASDISQTLRKKQLQGCSGTEDALSGRMMDVALSIMALIASGLTLEFFASAGTVAPISNRALTASGFEEEIYCGNPS